MSPGCRRLAFEDGVGLLGGAAGELVYTSPTNRRGAGCKLLWAPERHWGHGTYQCAMQAADKTNLLILVCRTR